MPPDSRDRIEALCVEALSKDGSERAAFLDQACAGDEALRREVDSLLAARSAASAVLETPAWSPAGPLAPGTRLGPYEILSLVGEGGMGQVYKARDTRLDRVVAIKVLPPTFATDPARRARFEREAKTIAVLNHPHICTLHDVGDHGGSIFLVMEYIAGETVAARLRRGPIPPADAMRIATEVADALAAAHRQGVIHRDLKPANLMLTKSGVKLLDFGLAKLRTPAPQQAEASTRTASSLATAPAVVLGTVPYMAPEQVEGKDADPRTDLFAFGVVLYEMLTGRRPFAGDTPQAVMAAILAHEPDAIDTVVPSTPPALARLVTKCLAKDPDARWQTAHDVADELRWLVAAKGGASSAATEAITASGRAVTRRWNRVPTLWRLAAVVAAAGAIVAVAGVSFRLVRPPTPAADTLLPYTSIVPLVTDASAETDPRISPDERWLSFLSDRDGPVRLFIKPIDLTAAAGSQEGAPRLVDVPGDALVSHAWSPNGREIACAVRERDTMSLKIVPAFSGGLPRLTVPLTPKPEAVRVSRWIGDSVYLDVAPRLAGHVIWRIELSRMRIDDLTSKWAPKVEAEAFDVSPQGERVLFSALDAKHRSDVWVANTDGTDRQRLTNDAWTERGPVWVGETGLVAFQSNRSGHPDLWEIDVRTRRTMQVTSSQGGALPGSATATGSALLFEHTADTANLWTRNTAGTSRQITEDALSDSAPVISRDGRQIAFQRTLPLLRESFEPVDVRLFVSSLSPDRMLADPRYVDDGFAARLSADGSWIAYFKRRPEGGGCLLVVRNLRTGDTRTASRTVPNPLFPNAPPYDPIDQPLTWSPRGAQLYFVNARQRIERLEVSGNADSATLLASRTDWFRDLHLSPDGRRLAYLRRSGDFLGPSGVFRLQIRDVESGRDETVWEGRGTWVSAFLKGWTRRGGLIMLRSRLDADRTNTLELLEIIARKARPVATVSGAYVATARLDPTGTRLYVTRAENRVMNVYAVGLSDGKLVRVTGNERRGISFSGIESLPDGSIFYSQGQLKRDIGFARRGAQ